MQGVYTKYRSMKKEIRHLAAVEIQRLWRGFISRHRSKQDRVSSFVSSTNAVSMSGGGGGGSATAQQPQRSSSTGAELVLRDLEEDGGSAMDVATSSLPPQPNKADMGALRGSTPSDVLSLSATVDTSTLYQQGRAAGGRGSASSGTGPTSGAGNGGARPLTPAVSTSGTSAALLSSAAVNSSAGAAGAATGSAESAQVMYARYKELLGEKRELKRLLKKFDEEFAAKHGRLPLKPEKEIMRPKYQKYHEIKHDMDLLRRNIEERHGPMPSDEDQDRDGSRERSLSLSESVDKLFADVGDESGSGRGSGKRTKERSGSATVGPPVTTSASINALLVAPPARSDVAVASGISNLR
jgi:hypothetical protein